MGTQPGGELLKKIEELEENIAHLKQELSKLKLSGLRETRAEQNYRRQRSHSISPQRSRFRASSWKEGSSSFKHSSPLQRESRSSEPQNGGEGDVSSEPSAVNFTDKLFRNILQSMGQSVHVLDLNCRIIYWNHSAENLYGFSAEEALGQDGIELIVDPRDFALVNNIVNCVKMGESWTGQFPARNKMGEKLLAVATNTPFYDDDGNLSGTICVSNDSQHFLEIRVPLSGATHFEPDLASSYPRSSAPSKFGLDTQQPLQVALASKLSNLGLKMTDEVKSKVRVVENNVDHEDGSRGSHHSEHSFSDSIISDQREDANSSGASTPLGDVPPFSFGEFYKVEEKSHGISLRDFGSDNEAKPIHNIITSKAEPRNQMKSLSWPFKANQQEGSEAGNIHVVWPWQQNDQENRSFNSKIPSVLKPRSQAANGNQPVNNEAPRSWSSSNVNNLNSVSSHGSAIINNKVIVDTDYLDYEILWEDLMIGEQIGKGSCGTVYRAMWYGSDIALKVFSKQDYSDDVVLSFRQEVSLMKRLRHPNVLLFMGVVTSPQLCIVTEFLPRGSLFCLLQRNTSKFNWRRRVHMAIDIARGVNYLHHCNPPIIHYDLKSANLLVDKNWTVKVGDFDLSRLKHEAYITTKTGKGTPQWMAPEVLRNEPSDEKSDIYSFGVIMWEIATEKIPWDTLNSMQVIGAVGFMNQRLEIPNDVDPRWADMIESCWHSDPACRPTSRELLERLREMQKVSAIQLHTARSASQSSTQNQKDSLIPS